MRFDRHVRVRVCCECVASVLRVCCVCDVSELCVCDLCLCFLCAVRALSGPSLWCESDVCVVYDVVVVSVMRLMCMCRVRVSALCARPMYVRAWCVRVVRAM